MQDLMGNAALLHRSVGTAAASVDDLVGPGGLLAIAPHPDDESLGCGALIRAAAEAGRPVAVAIVTDGAGSHPRSRAYPPRRLAALRACEARCAVARLAPQARIHFLHHPDGQGGGGPDEAQSVAHLATLAGSIGATGIVTTWSGDPHPDHRLAARLGGAVAAQRREARLWRYAVWGRFATLRHAQLPRPADIRRFPPGRHRRAKAAAVACHASQMAARVHDDATGFRMPAWLRRHFVDSPEIYLAG